MTPESHVCPWWLIRAFDNPLRRLFQDPEKTLRGILRPGESCLDVGCGYGHFVGLFQDLGADPANLHGLDLLPERIEAARQRRPEIAFRTGNAAELGSPGTFTSRPASSASPLTETALSPWRLVAVTCAPK